MEESTFSLGKHAFAETNGIRMHYVSAGKGPLVLLLHGFPEFWYAWRHQIPILAEHFQVVAPDLRGYGESDRPTGVENYTPKILTADICGLIQALGYERAHIVGHDWGGALAWNMALDFPSMVDKLAVLNCPHPAIFKKALRSNFRQIARSWYILFFQIPGLPEQLFKISPKTFLGLILNAASGTFSERDMEQYTKQIEKPGAFTAALNYYRAAFKGLEKKKEGQKTIAAPTLLIWGDGDKALGKELTEDMGPLFSGPFRIQYIPQCSHWVNEEQPDRVNQLLLDFLT